MRITSGPDTALMAFMLACLVKSLYKAMYKLFTQVSNGFEQGPASGGGSTNGHADDWSAAAASPRGSRDANAGGSPEGRSGAVADRARRLPLPRSRRAAAGGCRRAVRADAQCVRTTGGGRGVIRVLRAEIDEIEREWSAHLGTGRYGQLRDSLYEIA